MANSSPYENSIVLDTRALDKLIALIKHYPIAGPGTGITLNRGNIVYSWKEDENGNTVPDEIGPDRLQITNAYKFASTSAMSTKKSATGDTSNFNEEELLVNAACPNWEEDFPACICIIDTSAEEPMSQDDIMFVQGGSLLDFYTGTEPDSPINDNPDGSFIIVENNDKNHPTIVQIKGFDTNGGIHLTDDTEAMRYTGTAGTNGDPGLGQNGLTNLVGSITTYGGIAAGKSIKGYKLYGSVFNDYAEYRQSKEVKPGTCVVEVGDGSLVPSTQRLQAGANIVSDTFGFAIGETNKANTPIAVCGRVLAYVEDTPLLYTPGAAVCAAPEGKVSLMSRAEIREYPDRIVGYVSEIPNYDYWGADNVPVDGRIWIKVK